MTFGNKHIINDYSTDLGNNSRLESNITLTTMYHMATKGPQSMEPASAGGIGK